MTDEPKDRCDPSSSTPPNDGPLRLNFFVFSALTKERLVPNAIPIPIIPCYQCMSATYLTWRFVVSRPDSVHHDKAMLVSYCRRCMITSPLISLDIVKWFSSPSDL
jgi:hypothetical protein